MNLIFFRHNISLKVTSGERKSVADRMIDRNVTDRKIVLIIDNCPAHPSIFNLTNIQLVFLPPKTTQFFSQWTKVSLEILKRITEGDLCLCYTEPWRKTSLILGFRFYKTRPDSWEAVTKETVINCFKKAEINSDVQEAAIADSDDSFKDLQKKLNELKSADPSMVPKDVS